MRSAVLSASSPRAAFSPWNEIHIEHTVFLNTVPLLISIKSLKSSIPLPSSRSIALSMCVSIPLSLSLFTPRMLSCCLCWSLYPSCSVWGVLMFILISFIVLLYNIFRWGPQAQFVNRKESHYEKCMCSYFVVKKASVD